MLLYHVIDLHLHHVYIFHITVSNFRHFESLKHVDQQNTGYLCTRLFIVSHTRSQYAGNVYNNITYYIALHTSNIGVKLPSFVRTSVFYVVPSSVAVHIPGVDVM